MNYALDITEDHVIVIPLIAESEVDVAGGPPNP
jgi:hypothetical protein